MDLPIKKVVRNSAMKKLGIKRKISITGKRYSLKSAKYSSARSGVVYIGHLPHGFYEEELTGFFSQFGAVRRVKVSRSPRTGRSKGYAFVEFEYDDVAKIVAQTMNNYLMFERLVKAQYIPREKVDPRMFPTVKITAESYPRLARRNILKERQERKASDEDVAKHHKRIVSKLRRSVQFLADMGVDYCPQIYDPSKTDKSLPVVEEKIEKTEVKATESPSKLKKTVAKPSKVEKTEVKATESPSKLKKTVAKPSKVPVKTLKSVAAVAPVKNSPKNNKPATTKPSKLPVLKKKN